MIAREGYFLLPGHPAPPAFSPPSDPAFFPGLPIALHVLRGAGLSLNAAGLLVSNAAFLIGLLALDGIGRRLLPAADARRAAVYAAIFPASFVFSMVYPEAMAFALMTLSYLFALRGQWLACAVCAALATVTRPQGLFLAIPIGALVFSQWRALPFTHRVTATAAVLAAPVGLASFSLYLWDVEGDPLAWSTAERGWGRQFSATGVFHALRELAAAPSAHQAAAWLYRDAAAFLVYLVALVLAARAGIPASWIIASGLMLLVPLASGSFSSVTRFGLLALPVYWGLAVAGRQWPLNVGITTASVILLATGTATILLRWP